MFAFCVYLYKYFRSIAGKFKQFSVINYLFARLWHTMMIIFANVLATIIGSNQVKYVLYTAHLSRIDLYFVFRMLIASTFSIDNYVLLLDISVFMFTRRHWNPRE